MYMNFYDFLVKSEEEQGKYASFMKALKFSGLFRLFAISSHNKLEILKSMTTLPARIRIQNFYFP